MFYLNGLNLWSMMIPRSYMTLIYEMVFNLMRYIRYFKPS